MNIGLQFSVSSQGTEFKAAKFQSVEEKNNYVHAECCDRACIRAYDRHRESQISLERKETALQLAKTRYNFYLKWAKKNKKAGPSKIIPFPSDDLPA